MVLIWNMSLHNVILILWIILSFVQGHRERCKFPRSWKGIWYQNGLGEFHIKSRSIDGKGLCEDTQGNYYLVKNKESDCVRCLLFFERHNNILQYRESYCVPPGPLKSICSQIMVETKMYTLVKEPPTTIMCPLLDAYYFSYGDANTEKCEHALSYASPCVGGEKYKFDFQHCDKDAVLHDTNFYLECVAVWKEGSEKFMYGKLSGKTIATKEESYRCFKYEIYGSEIYMTMSLDSSCRGLFTARSGLFMMHLKKALYWPNPTCLFPKWLAGLPWRDTEGNNFYQLNGEGFSLLISSDGIGAVMKAEYRCIDIIKEKEDTTVILTYATIGCTSEYKCVKIKLLTSTVMSLQIGDVENHDNGDQCQIGTQYTQYNVIIPNTESVLPCPYPGIYPTTSSSTNCDGKLDIGCQNATNIVYRSSCPEEDFSLKCRVYWDDGNTTYVIAQPTNSQQHSRLQCYSFQRKDHTLKWRADPNCDHVTSKNFRYKDVSQFSVTTDQCIMNPTKDKSYENEVIKWSETLPRSPKHTPAHSPGILLISSSSSNNKNSNNNHNNNKNSGSSSSSSIHISSQTAETVKQTDYNTWDYSNQNNIQENTYQYYYEDGNEDEYHFGSHSKSRHHSKDSDEHGNDHSVRSDQRRHSANSKDIKTSGVLYSNSAVTIKYSMYLSLIYGLILCKGFIIFH